MRYLCGVFALLVILSLFGCASIFNGMGSESIQIQSTPPGAKCDIRTANSETIIATITTPNIVMLKKSAGYFRPAHYRVRCALDNKEPREASVNGRISGWYFGNIAIGGALGMLVIDPATGGMWTLSPETVVINYDESSKAVIKDAVPQTQDVSKAALPEADRATQ